MVGEVGAGFRVVVVKVEEDGTTERGWFMLENGLVGRCDGVYWVGLGMVWE